MKVKRFLLGALFFAWMLLAVAGATAVFDPFTAEGSRLAAFGIGVVWLVGAIFIGALMVETEQRRPPEWDSQSRRQARSRR